MPNLPDQLLDDYAHNFFGFGRWEAPIWFVGIEEAGGEDFQAISDRLSAWAGCGKRGPLQHAPAFYPASNQNEWHGNDAKPQATWKQLIRMLRIARSQDDAPHSILDYQRNDLGSASGETCLLELFPLPAPSVEEWPYHEWSDLPWLQTRSAYVAHVTKRRIAYLSQQIEEHRPRVVIFYGAGQLAHWAMIMGPEEYQRPIADKLISHERNGHLFFVTIHPTDPRIKQDPDAYFREMGSFFHRHYAERFS